MMRPFSLVRNLLAGSLYFFVQAGLFAQPVPVELSAHGGRWDLFRNGSPFQIKGVVGHTRLQLAGDYGANSVRAGWQKDKLDEINSHGLTALVNLPVKAERDGMDYDDTVALRKQQERIAAIVNDLKDHPAVLMYAIGNELDYIPPYEPFDIRVWDMVNSAAKNIHAIDSLHPVMTVIGTSMMHKVTDIARQCPDLDLLGINSYGDIFTLQDTLLKYGWTKPYVVTEWGPDGYWEVPRTPWRAPYEQTAREKLNAYRSKYLSTTSPENTQCIGSYVFYWSGEKQETTHTWFCLFDKTGLETPLVGLMKELWSGRQPDNAAPVADSMQIGNFLSPEPVVVQPGSTITAQVFVIDPDNDPLSFRWEIRPEAVYAAYAGQGEIEPEPLPGFENLNQREIEFEAPRQAGPYRLFAYAIDGKGHFTSVNLPFFVSTVLTDTSDIGQNTSRTLHRLQSSTSDPGDTIKILVYGQSISEQDWWLSVRDHLTAEFPHTILRMENRSIGGFASQILYKTVEMDVASYYPDLVLLHIFGDPVYYDSVLYTIRSRTTAEVAIMTDHYTGPHAWSDTMSYHILPALAEKYKCDVIQIRHAWKRFLEDNRIKPGMLLSDEVHLNDYGNLVMAGLVGSYFKTRVRAVGDPFGLVTKTAFPGVTHWEGDTLKLAFTGNRVDVVLDSFQSGFCRVLIDGLPPSAYSGTFYMSRPVDSTGRKWPWELPGMIRVRHAKPWLNEQWQCTFTRAEIPYDTFSFEIRGTLTGEEGSGTSVSRFESRSGRVIIEPGDAEEGGDWHLKRSYRITGARVNSGDRIRWRTYSISCDTLPTLPAGKSGTFTLFQGIPNTAHTLKLICSGGDRPQVQSVTVYRPYWIR